MTPLSPIHNTEINSTNTSDELLGTTAFECIMMRKHGDRLALISPDERDFSIEKGQFVLITPFTDRMSTSPEMLRRIYF